MKTDFRSNKTEFRILQLHVQESCNFSCDYCSHGSPNAKYKSNDAKVFIEYLKIMKNLANIKEFHLIGGEPFTHKDFNEFVKEFKDNNPYPDTPLAVFSNGSWVRSWRKFEYALTNINSLVITIHKELEKIMSYEEFASHVEYIKEAFGTKIRIDLIDQFEQLNFLDEPVKRKSCNFCPQLKSDGTLAKCHLIAYSQDIKNMSQSFKDSLHEGIVYLKHIDHDHLSKWHNQLHTCCDFCMFNRSDNIAVDHMTNDDLKNISKMLPDNSNNIRRNK